MLVVRKHARVPSMVDIYWTFIGHTLDIHWTLHWTLGNTGIRAFEKSHHVSHVTVLFTQFTDFSRLPMSNAMSKVCPMYVLCTSIVCPMSVLSQAHETH